MYIGAINRFNNNNRISYNSHINKPSTILRLPDNKHFTTRLAPLYKDVVSFSGRNINPLWNDFYSQFKKTFPDKKLEDFAYELVSIEKNKLGEGAKKKVYSIDGINDYVIAFLKSKKADKNAEFHPYKDPFPEFNFSQPIGGNNANFIIMRRIFGTTYGIKDWTAKFLGVNYSNKKIPESDAKFFLSQIENIESFPIESYIDLAKQFKYLNDKKIKVDMFNPNNLAVDNKNKKFTYFDLFDEDPAMFSPIKPQTNCIQDMINLLTDSLLHSEYLDALSQNDKLKLMTKTRNIAEKCHIAGRKVGLCEDNSISYQTFTLVQNVQIKRHGKSPDYLECYKKFLEAYSDL